ncbi:hypothetical protein DXG03_006598, partial [Asterophora parasitica]
MPRKNVSDAQSRRNPFDKDQITTQFEQYLQLEHSNRLENDAAPVPSTSKRPSAAESYLTRKSQKKQAEQSASSSTTTTVAAIPDPEPPNRTPSPIQIDNEPPPPPSSHAPDTSAIGDRGRVLPPTRPPPIRPTAPEIHPERLEPPENGPETGTYLPSFQVTESFLDAMAYATLEDSGMKPEDIARLRQPERDSTDLLDDSNRHLLKSVRHFINNTDSSRNYYENTRQIDLLTYPEDPFLSFNQVKRVETLSEVVPIHHDMCIDSCLAFTGPYAKLNACPICLKSRIDPKTKKPRRQFTTIPIGSVLQSLYGSPKIAEQMHYLERRLMELSDYVKKNGKLPQFEDFANVHVPTTSSLLETTESDPTYGASVGRGAFKFAPGKWTTVSQCIKLNSVGKADGEMELFTNGQSVINIKGLML